MSNFRGFLKKVLLETEDSSSGGRLQVTTRRLIEAAARSPSHICGTGIISAVIDLAGAYAVVGDWVPVDPDNTPADGAYWFRYRSKALPDVMAERVQGGVISGMTWKEYMTEIEGDEGTDVWTIPANAPPEL